MQSGYSIPTGNVFINSTSPSTATIFSTVSPPVANTPQLANQLSRQYVGTDGSQWVWNGTTYVSQPIGTPFYLAGTSTDAGSDKTSNISRTGSVSVGTPTIARATVTTDTLSTNMVVYNNTANPQLAASNSTIYLRGYTAGTSIGISTIAQSARAGSLTLIVNASPVTHTLSNSYSDLTYSSVSTIGGNSWLLLQTGGSGNLLQVGGGSNQSAGTTWAMRNVTFGNELQVDGLFAFSRDATARDMRVRTLSGTRSIMWSSEARFDATGRQEAGITGMTPVSVGTGGLLIDNSVITSASNRVSVHNVYDVTTGAWYRVTDWKYSTTSHSMKVEKM